MCYLRQLLILCLLALTCESTCAQTKPVELEGAAIVSADKDQPISAIQNVIELLNSHSIDSLKLQIEETPGVNVTITTRSNVESYAELKLLLQKAGVNNVKVRPAPIQWTDFSFAQLESAKKTTGAIVMLRADWCMVCNQIEKKTFADSKLISLVHESGVPLMRADFTDPSNAENEGVQFAKRIDEQIVPVFVVYPPNGAEKLIIRDAFDSAGISKFLIEHFPPKPETKKTLRQN